MEAQEAEEAEVAYGEMLKWAKRSSECRIAYASAVKQLGILIASRDVKQSMSFDNKVLALIKEDDSFEGLWTDYIMCQQKYKAAELLWKTYEHKINLIKFKNREVM